MEHMFDSRDARILIKAGLVVGGSSAIVLTVATVAGLAWRMFAVMAGV